MKRKAKSKYLVEYIERFLFFKPKKKLMITDDISNIYMTAFMFNTEKIFREAEILNIYKISKLR